MNLALLHYSAPPVVGGVERVLAQHARLMADAGHRVRVIAGRGEPFDPRVEFNPLPLADSRHPEVLAVKRQLDAGRVPPDFARLTGQLVEGLSQALANVDLLIAHNVCSLAKNLPLTAALRQLHHRPGAPRLILWHHDLAWTTPRYQDELHAGYPWDLLRTHWPGATHVAVSELRRRELAELLGLAPETFGNRGLAPETFGNRGLAPEAIRVIPSGVDAPAFLKLEPETRALVEQLRLLEAEPLLLAPVRITPRKNLELALRILAALRAGTRSPGGAAAARGSASPQGTGSGMGSGAPRAMLVVSGPPGPHNPANAEYFARLQALRAELGLEGAAHFLAELSEGYLPDAVIADLYRLADALLMPSREEGFGIPILEAGLSRLPVFCADIPPLRALGGEQASYFSPEADPREVAALIASRLGADRQGQLAARVRREYLWPQVYADRIAPLLDAGDAGGE
ncbi:MAG: glycosyltransferase [Chloroflexi bacterium]|nr:glycosyltransferase [Chloroflexota bacterium]